MHGQSNNNQPIVVAAIIIAAAVMILVIILALGSGGSSLADDRSSPERVLERVTNGLQANDPNQVWNEMSPEFQELFPLENWRQAAQESEATLGRVTAISVVSAPRMRDQAGWDGQWADAEIKVVRERETTHYLVRFVRQDGQWWLFGTLEIP